MSDYVWPDVNIDDLFTSMPLVIFTVWSLYVRRECVDVKTLLC